ncbi:uncharacterized protein [Nicotiana tomentosiformis]|uniref:uncharacterized protein n=1 Tax=Nicotiana tomentosiformis TaxID=4098 RepID=UPI00388CBBD7
MPTTTEGQRRQRLTQSDESVQKLGMSKLPIYKSMIQSPSKEDLNTSHNIAIRGQSKQRLVQLEERIQKQGMNKLHVNTSMLQSSSKKDLNTLRMSGRKQELYNFDAQAEVGDDEFVRDEDVNIDCVVDGTSEKKRDQGQTTCKNIHARSFEEREEVTFDKGQAVGPTDKRVSDLINFIGIIARNSRFITLVHTSWHVVSLDIKKQMWEYVNSKFIIPAEGEKWVMSGLRDAWRRHKRNLKMEYFNKNATDEDMLQNRPNEIPEVQFYQMIKYWKDSDIQRATKENNEEPSKSEMFIANRTKKGKEVHTDTQVAIVRHDAS